MPQDIVERLREHAKLAALAMYKIHICWEAADEIERLRKALEHISKGTPGTHSQDREDLLRGIARAALKEIGGDHG